jgi:hypothetical protein
MRVFLISFYFETFGIIFKENFGKFFLFLRSALSVFSAIFNHTCLKFDKSIEIYIES